MNLELSPDLDELKKAIKSFVDQIDELYGFYLDSSTGFLKNHEFIMQSQALNTAGVSPDIDQDSLPLYFGELAPTDPKNRVLHSTTQGEFKRRNGYKGQNHILLAQLMIVILYEYWETEYRHSIAKALGLQSAKELKISLLGDLRLLRNDILHCQGIASPETVNKLEILQKITPGTLIVPSAENIDWLIQALKTCLDNLVVDTGGADPRHRQPISVR